jgi:hypothetical protein
MVYIPSEVADRMYESLQHIQHLAKEIEGEVGESGIEDQAQTAETPKAWLIKNPKSSWGLPVACKYA